MHTISCSFSAIIVNFARGNKGNMEQASKVNNNGRKRTRNGVHLCCQLCPSNAYGC